MSNNKDNDYIEEIERLLSQIEELSKRERLTRAYNSIDISKIGVKSTHELKILYCYRHHQ